jgi:hypothetical protein
MDFIKRLFRGGDQSPGTNEQLDLDDAPIELPSDALDQKAGVGSVSSAKTSPGGVKWRNIAEETGHSSYAAEIDGVRVATVMKHEKGSSEREPWEWQLEVPTAGPRGGNSRILRDAKPAVEQALAGWES